MQAYVCGHMYVDICMQAYVCRHMCVDIHMSTYIRMWTYVCEHMYVVLQHAKQVCVNYKNTKCFHAFILDPSQNMPETKLINLAGYILHTLQSTKK